ncbi:N-acylglucosamine 2-epimerase-like [Lineus longissimus]|uniref:N-acylglucosamine 2-epimerase-like n=1 Tax=Lineus longissimus TaxID=88925 RepID=UPI002B4ED106
MAVVVDRLQEYFDQIRADLDRTVDFWMKHSHDKEHGGFLNCIGKTGELYDETKYCWLQGRQVWTYARLYNDIKRFRKPEILEEAVQGGKFLMSKVRDPSTYRCYFSLTRDGKPIKIQRTIFTECFYLMAMSELAIATKDDTYLNEAIKMRDKLFFWTDVDDTDIVGSRLPGDVPANTMGVHFMLLAVISQLMRHKKEEDLEFYQEKAIHCVGKLQLHIQRNGAVILENVSQDGDELPGCQGRLMIPGHAIEAGWFLLEYTDNFPNDSDENLVKTALQNFILNPFKTGWDKEHGGLFYMLDADGLSPTILEWNMKLWWPHNEAMIAFLMAYMKTKDQLYLEKFAQVFDYTYTHFVDEEHGEWFGYLNQQGDISMDFKGGPFKGCFHVPRCLMICEQLLQQITVNKQ